MDFRVSARKDAPGRGWKHKVSNPRIPGSTTPPEGVPAGELTQSLPTELSPSSVVLAEEVAEVSRSDVRTGKVRISTRTETRDEVIEIPLDQNIVEILRVAIDRVVEAPPASRTVGNTTIIPVMEERVVTTKQLVLKEEIHLIRRTNTEVAREAIPLRRQEVVIERFDAEGNAISGDAS